MSTEKGPDQPATDQSPENAPATLDQEVRPVGVREGMFGVTGSGDTSGYGGLVQPIVFPAAAQRPFDGWHEEVAAALDTALAGGEVEHAVENVVIHRGEITFHVRREDLPAVAKLLRDDPALSFEFCSGCLGRQLPGRHRPRAARRLPPALDDLQPADPARGQLPRQRPAHPVDRDDVPHQRLARARDVRHVRHRLRRPPGTHPHPHAGRLARPPPAQGLPAGRHPRGVQGRHDPAARRAEGYS